MAKRGGKTKTSWDKGKSGNPGGRPALPDDVKAAKQMDRVAFARELHRVLHMTPQELHDSLGGPGSNMMHEIVASVMIKAVEDGDGGRLEMLLRRYIGPVETEITISAPKRTIIRRHDGTSEELTNSLHEEKEEG